MKKEVSEWENFVYNEKGEANRSVATTGFDIPTELYVEKEDCERQYCAETGCDLFCWKLKWNSKNSKRENVSPTGEILPEFLRLLNENKPEKFARKVEIFAQKWGNLDLCKEHQMPVGHNYRCEPSIPHEKIVFRSVRSSGVSEINHIYGESLSGWRDYSVFAKSLLNIAANLQEEKIGDNEDWENLHKIGFLGWSHVERRKEKKYQKNLIEFEKNLIANGVNQWLNLGNLRPEIRWENNDIIIDFKSASSYGSLFAYLALQILLAIGKQDGLAICSACGIPYIPDRKPASNKRRFCPQCRKSGKQQALASQDYRKRTKQKNFL